MASGTISTRPEAESAPIQGRYEEFIQKRLEHTRRQVRLVDIGSGVVLLLAASLLFFLAVAVADHWLFAHGLNFFARLALWAVWVAVAGYFVWRSVAPSVLHRINPVFAAQTIEQGRLTLKNSLINFLLLRSHPDAVAPVVFRAMEHRAAADLSRVPVEHAVDHRRLIHLCYVLAVAVVLFALYLAFSPKNPLVSAARILWPWGDIPAPTRVHIEDIAPGDAVVFQGERQTITARVSGLRDGEDVSLLLSTADGQFVDDRVAMTHSGEDNRYTCTLPVGEGGMQLDALYRITAGDSTTNQFKLEVQIAPSIVVDRVDYHFPAYTGIPDRTVKGQGDIKALEGTRVTVHATSNLDIKNAHVELRGTETGTIQMTHRGKLATGEFTLAVDAGQSWRPLFDRYQILFTDSEGHESRHPIRYHIDVDRDTPPEIAIIEPKQETVTARLDGHVRIRVHAIDDFGLRRVKLQAECNGIPCDLPVLLDRVSPEKSLSKPFDGEFDFRPAAFSLKNGDEVKYWAEAEDNKDPKSNHADTKSKPRIIRIVDGEQGAKNDQANQEQRPGEQADRGNNNPQKGTNGEGKDNKDSGNADNARDDSPDKANKEEGASASKGGGKGTTDKSKKPQPGDKGDSSKSENNTGEKDASSADSKDGKNGEEKSSDGGEQGNKRTDSESQRADAIKKILEDAKQQSDKEQKQNNTKPSDDDSKSDQKNPSPQNGDNNSGDQTGDPNKGDQSQSPKPGNSGGKSPKGGKGDQSRGASADTKQGGSSGDDKQKTKPGDSATNDRPGQQSTPGSQEAGTQPKETTSPQSADKGNNAGSPQPKSGQKPGEKRDGNPSASENAAAKGTKPTEPSTGAEKSSGKPGGETKPDPKQTGGANSQEKSPSAGAQSPKEQMPGGKQGGDQTGADPSKGQKPPSGNDGGANNSQLAMNNRPKPGDKSEPKGGSAGESGQKPKSQPEKKDGAGGSGQPQPKTGNDQQPSGSSHGGDKSPKGAKSDNPGDAANDKPRQMDPSSKGETTPPTDNGPGEKKAGNSNSAGPKPNNPQSPGSSDKPSESKGQSDGAPKGGGAGGGGQQSKENGRGAKGSHSVGGDDGGKVSDEKGPGATGKNAGDTARSNDKTGSQQKESGPGNGDKTDPSKEPSAKDAPNAENSSSTNGSENASESNSNQRDAAASQRGGRQGTGLPTGGSQAGDQAAPPPGQHAPAGPPEDADLAFAKKQVDLALRHLKDEMSKQKPELLDRLGWTPEEAKKFADNLEKLRDAAQKPGNDGDASKQYNEFLKDLGLRPHGTRIAGGTTQNDSLRGVRDAGQIEPPAEWADAVRRYSQSTAEERK